MARRIFITAGAGGIGAAVARRFAENGDKVYVNDIDAEAVAALVASHENISGGAADMSDPQDVVRSLEEGVAELGGLDVLVNNAGVSGPTKSVEEMSIEEFQGVVQVNLVGTFTITHAAIPHLRRSEAGNIVSMSSVGGRYGYPNRSPYAVTKRGIIAFTETLALELGDAGIRANAVAPGAVAGARIDTVLQGRAEATGLPLAEVTAAAMGNQTLKQFVEPTEIADLIAFIVSDSARSITGHTFTIDNGSRAAQ